MTFYSRVERFGAVDSTQSVVREWLEAGTPEVVVAVAAEQTAGRGRLDRSWTAPPGVGLLLSAGFRPTNLPLRHGWRLAAVLSLAMIDAAEAAAGLADGTLKLKWPNDIVAAPPAGELLKVAGVLGETVASGDRLGSAVVGIGVNADWAKVDFPPHLASTMTSLRELSGGRPIDRDKLLEEFLARLEPRYEALLGGQFDAAGWTARQVTTGSEVEVDMGGRIVSGRASGVDPESGALVIEGHPSVHSGEVVRCRVSHITA